MNYLQLLEHSEKERNTALLSLDMNQIKVYCIRFGLFISDNDDAFLESIHKAVLQIRDASFEQKEKYSTSKEKHSFGMWWALLF